MARTTMTVNELDWQQLEELKSRYYTDMVQQTEGREPSMSELADVDSLVDNETIYAVYGGITFTRDDFNCTTGNTKYELICYDTWADGDDGWVINDIQHTGRYVIINDDASSVEILKVLVAEGILKSEFAKQLNVDFVDGGRDFIEFSDIENDYCPQFRLEEVA